MRRHARIESLESRRLFASTHFAVIGDFGNDSQAELDVANMVKSWNPDYIVTLGDNSYQTASPFSLLDKNVGKYYHDYIYNYAGTYGAGSPTRRFFATMGNHDWGNVTPGDASVYLNYFDLPGNERYYDFVQGPVHFFVLDSDGNEPDGNTANSAQAQWLKGKLAAATEPHKVVVFHHPAFTSGTAHHSTIGMRWPFAKWGATAVMAGHEHSYERLSEAGITYFVNGVGGAELAGIGTPIAGSQVRYNADYGAMLVDANDTTMTTRFYSRTGMLIDQYTINLAANASMIRAGSDWKYFAQGVSPAGDWKATSFNDAAWPAGPAQLGYGDGDESTAVAFGPNVNAKYTTTYFRKTFSVSNPFAITGLNLSLLRDDGVIVYLNGQKVFTSNMPASGTISYSTPASSAIGGEDEGNWYSTAVDPNLLVAGNNTIAVELHQSSGDSSDISFDLALNASLDVAPPTVTSINLALNTSPMALTVGFSEPLDSPPESSDFVLSNLTTGHALAISNMSVTYDAALRFATLRFPGLLGGVLSDGNWQLQVLASGISDRAGNTLAQTSPYNFFILGGDANRDRMVDIRDLYILVSNWQQSQKAFLSGDFTGDGTVDGADLAILSVHWQGRLAAPAQPVLLAARPPVRQARLISYVME